jgi:hypothetical protein
MTEETQFARRVLVCGGRDYRDRDALFLTMDAVVMRLCVDGLPDLCHGGADGADRLAGEWAKSRGVRCTVFPADWKTYGRAAGPIRNAEMLATFKPDLAVAFPGGTGTADMVRKANRAGVRVVYGPMGEGNDE